MAKMTWKDHVRRINEELGLLNPIETKYGEKRAVEDLQRRQDNSDAFVEEDFLDSETIGLPIETVRWLDRNNVRFPASWRDSL